MSPVLKFNGVVHTQLSCGRERERERASHGQNWWHSGESHWLACAPSEQQMWQERRPPGAPPLTPPRSATAVLTSLSFSSSFPLPSLPPWGDPGGGPGPVAPAARAAEIKQDLKRASPFLFCCSRLRRHCHGRDGRL
jgi:hypothetical protein